MNKLIVLFFSLLLAASVFAGTTEPGKADKNVAFIDTLNELQKAKTVFFINDSGSPVLLRKFLLTCLTKTNFHPLPQQVKKKEQDMVW